MPLAVGGNKNPAFGSCEHLHRQIATGERLDQSGTPASDYVRVVIGASGSPASLVVAGQSVSGVFTVEQFTTADGPVVRIAGEYSVAKVRSLSFKLGVGF